MRNKTVLIVAVRVVEYVDGEVRIHDCQSKKHAYIGAADYAQMMAVARSAEFEELVREERKAMMKDGGK